MNRVLKPYFFLFLLLYARINYSQQDTLLEQYRKEVAGPASDTDKVKSLYKLSWQLIQHGQLVEATKHAEEGLALAKKLNFKKGISWNNHALAVIMQERGDYPASLRFAFEALKIREEANSPQGIRDSYITIGNIYSFQKDYKTALGYYTKAIDLSQQLGQKSTVAICYMNMGIVYRFLKQFDKALEYQNNALRIKEEFKDSGGIASSNVAIANIYMETGKYEESLKKHQEVLKYAEAADVGELIALSYGNIGAVYYLMKKPDKAIYYLNEGVKRAKAMGLKDALVRDYEALAAADSLAGNFKEALLNYKMYVIYKDSLVNDQNTREITQVQMQYKFDKKASEDKAIQEKKDVLTSAKLRQQKTQRNYFIVGFVLVLLLAVFILYSFLQKKKANLLLEEKNLLIERQKHEVEQKQKEILDSIHYAKRIQQTLITSELYISRNLSRLKRF